MTTSASSTPTSTSTSTADTDSSPAFSAASVMEGPCPGATWDECAPADAGLSQTGLDTLAAHVGGRGAVVRGGRLAFSWGDAARSGDLASTRKPIISTLLLLAVQEGKLTSVDDPVADFEPRLRDLNGGKDAAMTWRHLASQTSGYGWSEAPGAAWSYNDYALALYYDTLMDGVFGEHGTAVLQGRLAQPLQFQDAAHFQAFGTVGPDSHRTGRIAMSPRDHARFGLLYLRGGAWHGQQLVRRDLIHPPSRGLSRRASRRLRAWTRRCCRGNGRTAATSARTTGGRGSTASTGGSTCRTATAT